MAAGRCVAKRILDQVKGQEDFVHMFVQEAKVQGQDVIVLMEMTMRNLMTEFYRSIQTNTPQPISNAEMLQVTRIMDEIFADCRLREESVRESVPTTSVLEVAR